MKKATLLGMVFIATLLMQCKVVSFDKTPPFTVTEATYSYWVGGQPGVRGTNVFIYYDAEAAVAFDSIYFNNAVVKIQLKTNKGKTYLAGHFNTSTVHRKEDLILHADEKKEVQNKKPILKKLPFELKEGEAVISYKEGEKQKYFKIQGLKKTKGVIYQ